MFDFVCDRLGSPSDLVKSWEGSVTVACGVPRGDIELTGHSAILYLFSVTRALLIALWLHGHTNGGKLRYKYSSGRQRGHLSV